MKALIALILGILRAVLTYAFLVLTLIAIAKNKEMIAIALAILFVGISILCLVDTQEIERRE